MTEFVTIPHALFSSSVIGVSCKMLIILYGTYFIGYILYFGYQHDLVTGCNKQTSPYIDNMLHSSSFENKVCENKHVRKLLIYY